MDTKRCYTCKQELPVDNFYKAKANRDGLFGKCKDCLQNYKKRWRQQYREKHGEDDGKRWRRANREKLRHYKDKAVMQRQEWVNDFKDVPCADCGNKYPPVCMDFDHVELDKDKGIAILTNGRYGRDRILEEIRKCEVVCANCHRLRTYKREKTWATSRKLPRNGQGF